MFQFKKFSINQDSCAMKICTDACIFGGYIDASESKRILDIGTGTGLLSLMLAQRTDNASSNFDKKPIITAIEIEKEAFLAAKDNFEKSIYNERLEIYHNSAQKFSKNYSSTFDHIISNPPFFLHQSKTKNTPKNLALHSEALSFNELIEIIDKLLSKDGKCDILLPAYEMDVFIKKAKHHNLSVQKKMNIYTRKEQGIFRVITRFVRDKFEENREKEILITDFVIYKSKNEKDINLNRGYTDEFVALLREFYIIF
ncbi:methyltransferase [Bernardetia sp. Wsw4-3y2]|uniref:tRNA1(Val) (adenine(37)-N6)-methyltransferase n=1 Tax=unclassified Bernardetia TaxID=2647129 RepID=UPI0030D52D01